MNSMRRPTQPRVLGSKVEQFSILTTHARARLLYRGLSQNNILSKFVVVMIVTVDTCWFDERCLSASMQLITFKNGLF